MPPGSQPELTGLNLDNVRTWFAAEVPMCRPPLTFSLLAGGYSNLTYEVHDATGRSWVLRRPPVGQLATGAHSMQREWQILSALQTTDVPVPPTVALCQDRDVTGADFYVMTHVAGTVVDSSATAATLSERSATQLGDHMVDTLVRLHQVDTAITGRTAAPDAKPYVARQLELWMRQLQEGDPSRTGDVGAIRNLLAEHAPPQRWTGVVHGDYRLGNLLVSSTGRVQAVLDWELWTIGDTMADLGWLVAWWSLNSDDGWSPQHDPGYPVADQLAARYHQMSGRDVSELPFYTAFALWRLACIAEGVYSRWASGRMGTPPVPLEALAARPEELAAASRDALK